MTREKEHAAMTTTKTFAIWQLENIVSGHDAHTYSPARLAEIAAAAGYSSMEQARVALARPTSHARPVILPAFARAAAIELAVLAPRIAAREDAAHRPTGALRAIRAWDAGCMRAIGADPALRLPAWPTWRGIPRSPIEFTALIVEAERTAGMVAKLAEEVRAWAEACEAQQQGRVAA